MKNEENKHIIAFRKSDLILPIIVTIFFIVITFFIYRDDKFAGFLVGALALLSTVLTLYSTYATLFIKVYIGENSFTHQKAPGVSKTYNYSDITEAWVSSGKSTSGANSRYFNYKTKDGRVHKFVVCLYQCDETDYLLEKINGAEMTDDE